MAPDAPRLGTSRLTEAGENAAQKIENKIAAMTHLVFNIIAENPEIKHVAKQVGGAAVHEHRRKQRKVNRHRRHLQSRHFKPVARERVQENFGAGYHIIAGKDLGRHGGIRKAKVQIPPPVLQKYKHNYVEQDKKIIDYRCAFPVRVIIANGYEHCFELTFANLVPPNKKRYCFTNQINLRT